MGPNDVIIEPVFGDGPQAGAGPEQPDGGSAHGRWRIRSAGDRFPALVVPEQKEALDAALARLNGTSGELYIRTAADEEPTRFNPTGG